MKWLKENWVWIQFVLAAIAIFSTIMFLLRQDSNRADACNKACRPYVGKRIYGEGCHCLDDEKRWVPTELPEAAR